MKPAPGRGDTVPGFQAPDRRSYEVNGENNGE